RTQEPLVDDVLSGGAAGVFPVSTAVGRDTSRFAPLALLLAGHRAVSLRPTEQDGGLFATRGSGASHLVETRAGGKAGHCGVGSDVPARNYTRAHDGLVG